MKNIQDTINEGLFGSNNLEACLKKMEKEKMSTFEIVEKVLYAIIDLTDKNDKSGAQIGKKETYKAVKKWLSEVSI